jgi:hypothetical protein
MCVIYAWQCVYSRPIAAQYCISQKGNDERHAYQVHCHYLLAHPPSRPLPSGQIHNIKA